MKTVYRVLLLAMLSFSCVAQPVPSATPEQNRALEEIRRFCIDMNAADPRYIEIEKKLMPFIGDVVRDYPPQQWLGIIKMLYQVRATP